MRYSGDKQRREAVSAGALLRKLLPTTEVKRAFRGKSNVLIPFGRPHFTPAAIALTLLVLPLGRSCAAPGLPPTFPYGKALIHTGRVVYAIPWRFINIYDPSYPSLRLVFPQLAPLALAPRSCRGELREDCFPITLIIGGNSTGMTSEQALKNSLQLKFRPPKVDMYGFTVYEFGPADNSTGGLYIKRSRTGTIWFDCEGPPARLRDVGVCQDYLFLSDGNAVTIIFARAHRSAAMQMETAVRALMNKFNAQGAS